MACHLMEQQILDAFILLSSGAGKMRGKEMFLEDEDGLTIEFPDLTPTHAIVRDYYSNGNKHYEEEYKNGKLNGKYSEWFEDGTKWSEGEYKNGNEHGKNIVWEEDGTKVIERNYKNGVLHGKSFGWFADGKKEFKKIYKNGRLMSEVRRYRYKDQEN